MTRSHADDANFPMDSIVRQTKVELARRRKPDETAASGTSDDVESRGAPGARAPPPRAVVRSRR